MSADDPRPGDTPGPGTIRREDRLYVVLWSTDGQSWSMVTDQRVGRGPAPAAYIGEIAAYERRDEMAQQWPDHHYRVAVFDAR